MTFETEKYPLAAVGALMAVFAVLLFFRLGHYALWEDEAVTVFPAKALLQTGDDTSAVAEGGKQVMGWSDGLLLYKGRQIHEPPLASWLVTPSLWLLGETSLAARLPLAVAGLCAACLLLFALWRLWRCRMAQILAALAMVCHVPFILYCRQSRYYAAALLFGIAVVFCYLARGKIRHAPLWMAGASIALFASNLVVFAMCFGALAVDYVVFELRKNLREDLRRMWPAPVLIAVFCGLILLRYNPFLTPDASSLSLFSRSSAVLEIWLYRWRDLNHCEFLSAGLAVASLAVAVWKKDVVLARAWLFAFVYSVLAALAEGDGPPPALFTDVRDLIGLIPVFILISVRTIVLLTRGRWCFALPLALVAFGCNLFNGGPLLTARFAGLARVHRSQFTGSRAPDSGDLRHGLRSTLADYIHELTHPRMDPYRAASEYINKNIPENALVWTLPWFTPYSLMYHAKGPVYGWQLSWPPREGLGHLSEKHFIGRVPPDYIICFGPILYEWLIPTLRRINSPQMNYERVAILDCYWLPHHRAELFWRVFKPIKGHDPRIEGIHVLKRIPPPPPPAIDGSNQTFSTKGAKDITKGTKDPNR